MEFWGQNDEKTRAKAIVKKFCQDFPISQKGMKDLFSQFSIITRKNKTILCKRSGKILR